MGINNELLRKIDQGYLKFSKGQKKLADYIRKNYDKAAFLTAAKMGEVVGVSESTVVRFATALGYKGYPGISKSAGRTCPYKTEFYSADGSNIRKDQPGRDTGIRSSVRY